MNTKIFRRPLIGFSLFFSTFFVIPIGLQAESPALSIQGGMFLTHGELSETMPYGGSASIVFTLPADNIGLGWVANHFNLQSGYIRTANGQDLAHGPLLLGGPRWNLYKFSSHQGILSAGAMPGLALLAMEGGGDSFLNPTFYGRAIAEYHLGFGQWATYLQVYSAYLNDADVFILHSGLTIGSSLKF